MNTSVENTFRLRYSKDVMHCNMTMELLQLKESFPFNFQTLYPQYAESAIITLRQKSSKVKSVVLINTY